MPVSEANLYRAYLNNRVNAAQALEALRLKSLSDGYFYYIGFNQYRPDIIEIFKSKIEGSQLSAEEIDRALAEKCLYIFKSKGGWLTIRRIPPDADKMLQLWNADEKGTM